MGVVKLAVLLEHFHVPRRGHALIHQLELPRLAAAGAGLVKLRPRTGFIKKEHHQLPPHIHRCHRRAVAEQERLFALLFLGSCFVRRIQGRHPDQPIPMPEILDVLFAYVLILLLRIAAALLGLHIFCDSLMQVRHFPEQPTTALARWRRWAEPSRLFFQNFPILRNLLVHLIQRHALECHLHGIKRAGRGHREAADIKTANAQCQRSTRIQHRLHPRRQRARALGAVTQPTTDDD